MDSKFELTEQEKSILSSLRQDLKFHGVAGALYFNSIKYGRMIFLGYEILSDDGEKILIKSDPTDFDKDIDYAFLLIETKDPIMMQKDELDLEVYMPYDVIPASNEDKVLMLGREDLRFKILNGIEPLNDFTYENIGNQLMDFDEKKWEKESGENEKKYKKLFSIPTLETAGIFLITSSGNVVEADPNENVSGDFDEADYKIINYGMGSNYGGIDYFHIGDFYRLKFHDYLFEKGIYNPVNPTPSDRTKNVLRKYGYKKPLEAYRLHNEKGYGASTVSYEMELGSTNIADSLIDAGRDLHGEA
jgi:hypothetical protein